MLRCTSIKSGAFSGCTGLTSVNIPSGVTSIDAHTFRDCIGLTSVSIPASVTSIESGAFIGCTGLASITIGENVKIDIGSWWSSASFENNFTAYYNTNGKKAGVYTWSGDAWSYSG